MKTTTQKILLAMFLLGAFLLPVVPSALAMDRSQTIAARPGDAGRIQVTVNSQFSGRMPVSVVLYNKSGQVVAEQEAVSGRALFDRLSADDYRVTAYAENGEVNTADDVAVFAHRTTAVTVKLEPTAQAKAAAKAGRYCSEYVTGDGSQLKISGGFGQQFLYYQCGHLIGKVGSPSYRCGCGGSGYHYTTNCTKVSPVVIVLPCPKH
ncbi:MAG: hypothetical protein ACKOC5_04620 [Chloroflexota bacterium]